jgi:hypothetical protein
MNSTSFGTCRAFYSLMRRVSSTLPTTVASRPYHRGPDGLSPDVGRGLRPVVVTGNRQIAFDDVGSAWSLRDHV